MSPSGILFFRSTLTSWAFRFWRPRRKTRPTLIRPSWLWPRGSRTGSDPLHPRAPRDKSRLSQPRSSRRAAPAAAKKISFFIRKKFEGIRIITICNIIASSSRGDDRDVAHSIVANHRTFYFAAAATTSTPISKLFFFFKICQLVKKELFLKIVFLNRFLPPPCFRRLFPVLWFFLRFRIISFIFANNFHFIQSPRLVNVGSLGWFMGGLIED